MLVLVVLLLARSHWPVCKAYLLVVAYVFLNVMLEAHRHTDTQKQNMRMRIAQFENGLLQTASTSEMQKYANFGGQPGWR